MSIGPTNRELLAEHLVNATAKHLVTLTAASASVEEMTALIKRAATQRVAEIEEAAARDEADVA